MVCHLPPDHQWCSPSPSLSSLQPKPTLALPSS
ncbi:hypothetical protein ACOTFF_23395 [Achromobacter xylosoxidans]